MTANLKRARPAFAFAALAIASASAMAVTLPPFTFTPGGALLNGGVVMADNIVVSDFGTVGLSGSTFTDSGFLAVQSFQLNSTTVASTGLNSTYGLYFTYSGNGTLSAAGNPLTTATAGTFSQLTFTLYGYNGPAATFTPTSTTATGAVQLATGKLLPGPGNGSVFTAPQNPSFTAGASANTSFTVLSSGFFTSPNPFYNVAVSSFINSPTQVVPTANGFTIQQGGGSVNFVSAVPEPETYALMLGGLGVVGMLARRRRAV